MVRSTTPKDPSNSPIEITPGIAQRSKSSDPETFWLNYWRTHPGDKEEDKDKLRTTVGLLNVSKKYRDVQACLTAFLRFHGKDAEPWMYSGLAVAIRMNKGNEADVKLSLGYAADLAVRNRNPNDLVSVADQMILLGESGRAGGLLDQAMSIVPHRGEPMLLSMELAQRTRDPKRMADGAERLLALGWPGDPGFDEGVRREARRRVETLAKSLREEGRSTEADDLLQRLSASEARDLFVRLTWVGDADLDIVADDPRGTTTRVLTPRTLNGGAIIKNGYGNHPEEVYVCPRGFDGVYTIHVETIYNSEEKPALKATLEIITHEGTPEEHKESRTITLGKKPETVKIALKGGRRTTAMPFIAPTIIKLPSKPANPRRKPAAPDAAPTDTAPGPGTPPIPIR